MRHVFRWAMRLNHMKQPAWVRFQPDLREGNRMNPVPVLSSVADNQHQDPQAEDGMQARESAQHVWHMCGLLARPLHGQFHRVGPRDALSCPRPAMRTTGEYIPFTKPSLPFLVFG